MTNSLRADTRARRCRTAAAVVARPRDSDARSSSGRVCERGVYPTCQVTPLRLGDATIVLSPPADPSRIVGAVGYRYRDPAPRPAHGMCLCVQASAVWFVAISK